MARIEACFWICRDSCRGYSFALPNQTIFVEMLTNAEADLFMRALLPIVSVLPRLSQVAAR